MEGSRAGTWPWDRSSSHWGASGTAQPPLSCFCFPGSRDWEARGKTEHMQIPALGNDPGALTEDGLLPALPGTLQAPHPTHPTLGSHQLGPDPESFCKFCPAHGLTTLRERSTTTETSATPWQRTGWNSLPGCSCPLLSPSHGACLRDSSSP